MCRQATGQFWLLSILFFFETGSLTDLELAKQAKLGWLPSKAQGSTYLSSPANYKHTPTHLAFYVGSGGIELGSSCSQGNHFNSAFIPLTLGVDTEVIFQDRHIP